MVYHHFPHKNGKSMDILTSFRHLELEKSWKMHVGPTFGLYHQRSPAIPGLRSQRRTASRTASALSRKWLCWALLGANSTSARSSKSAPTHTYTHTRIHIHNWLVYIYTHMMTAMYIGYMKINIILHYITSHYECLYIHILAAYTVYYAPQWIGDASGQWGMQHEHPGMHILPYSLPGCEKRFPGFEPYPFIYESFPVSR